MRDVRFHQMVKEISTGAKKQGAWHPFSLVHISMCTRALELRYSGGFLTAELLTKVKYFWSQQFRW